MGQYKRLENIPEIHVYTIPIYQHVRVYACVRVRMCVGRRIRPPRAALSTLASLYANLRKSAGEGLLKSRTKHKGLLTDSTQHCTLFFMCFFLHVECYLIFFRANIDFCAHKNL